jgi:hypothetical protein
MKISEPKWSPYSAEANQDALDNPQVGDYWSEHFCPYFIVVAVQDKKITVLSCLGGLASFTRKDEPNAKLDNKDGTWSFDYSRHMVVDHAWMSKAVKYSTNDGFCAMVSRGKMMGCVEEWRQFHRVRLTKELEELGV